MQLPDLTLRSALRWTWPLAGLLALASFVLFTRHLDFPYLYHTDEPSKVQQVIQGRYNFHHPLLLLRATEAVVQATGTPLSPQPVVEKGRLVSAVFAALAVGALVLFATRLAGRPAGVLAGLLAMIHPVLFELAHYMKEDSALLMGVVVAALAIANYARRPSLIAAAIVGLGGGLAVSGKYLGCLTAAFALLALSFNSSLPHRRWLVVLTAAVCMFVTFGVINYPAFQASDKAATSLEKELQKVEKRAQERPEPVQLKHVSKLGTTLSVPLLAGIVYWVWRRWRVRRHEPLIFRALAIFFVGYFLIVSLAPKTKDRYLLPVYILGCALGAAGLVEWHRHYRKHRKSYTRGIPRFIAVAAVVWHLPGLVDAYRAFQRDDRRELASFIREFLPPESGIAHDVRVLLARGKQAGLEEFLLPNTLHVAPDRYVADLGSIAELRALGVTHVAVCEADYHNTFKQGGDPRMADRNRWYAELFRNHSVVWRRRVGVNAYLQPGLRLYRITSDSPPPPPED